ncbi:plastocyanin/azurin family copper-binding protein [Psychromonas sp. Urea-02u-13]|uniref:plastocyanin/azurin family copper-binding protein n=1 Tax=Psychromonas sp. Urea-02u-13 TaxID=2058326 RepID=UPI0012FE9657|nr:plastocyanin/azurin family copper-binding protein [Psychromonas sp. Urea-02u-13]
MKISGFEFSPKELTVNIGDRVIWLNEDITPHNIIISTTGKRITPDLSSTESATYTITQSINYQCGLHPSMVGKILINKNIQ